MLLDILERHHFTCYKPYGAYYIMTDISAFGFGDDVEFARYLVKDVGVAAVPGQQLLQDAERRAHEAALLFLQAGRDAGGSGSPPREARGGGARDSDAFDCSSGGSLIAGGFDSSFHVRTLRREQLEPNEERQKRTISVSTPNEQRQRVERRASVLGDDADVDAVEFEGARVFLNA